MGTSNVYVDSKTTRRECTVAVADRVKSENGEINNELPKGTQLSVNFDMTMFIRDSVNELVFTLLLSAF